MEERIEGKRRRKKGWTSSGDI